ncbi:hypothetical protein NKDENANG_02915 [Candidatus Entotheonellaceae bacterium PAL068K]
MAAKSWPKFIFPSAVIIKANITYFNNYMSSIKFMLMTMVSTVSMVTDDIYGIDHIQYNIF